jgi:hypothetical protein
MTCSRRKQEMLRRAVSAIACFTSLLLCGSEAMAFRIVEALPEARVEGGMLMPTDADFGDDGTLYVLDGYQGRIVVRHPDGKTAVRVPEEPCRFARALGIAVHGSLIYVADPERGTVCELDADGRCLRNIRMPPASGQGLSRPTDVAIEGDRAVVADRGANLLYLVRYPSFEPILTAGRWGPEGGSLNSPYLVAMRSGKILVADMMNGRMVRLDGQGAYQGSLGERGVREGQFVRPKGAAIASNGRVFVSDSTLGVVQVFDSEFRYQGTVGSKGEPHEFEHPAGLALREDLLAVVEQKSGRVSLMRLRPP